MKLNISLLATMLMAVTIATTAVHCNIHKQYFDINSCFLRDPSVSGLTEKSSDLSPFRLSVSRSTYDLSPNSEPLTVSIVKKTEAEESLSSPVKEIESFMIQAIHATDDSIVGQWLSKSNYDEDARTLNCFGEANTLIKTGGVENMKNNIAFSWRFDDSNQLDNQTQIYFVATIVRNDGTYWLNVESDLVTLINTYVSQFASPTSHQQNTLEISNQIVEEATEASSNLSLRSAPVVAQKGNNNNNQLHRRSKRDVTKHFEASTYQCGTRRSCYVSLKTCDVDPKTCNFVLSWAFDGEFVNYELTGLSHAWIAVVLTQDQHMGDDNVVVCSRDENEQLSVDHYFKSKDSKLTKFDQDAYLTDKFISFNEAGFIYCKFSRRAAVAKPEGDGEENDDADQRDLVIDLTKPNHVYVERGAPGENLVEKLDQRFQPSDQAVEFTDSVYVHRSSRSWLVKLHAILGIIAWIFLGSLGILLARYYKPMWPNHVLYSFRVWFSFHRSIMVFVTLLTILSLLFALIEMDWHWSDQGHNFVHAILGLIVFICSIINPILGLFRPSPSSKFRCVFFWLHWLVGSIAYCLAVPCIFIGMDLSKSDLPNWCAWLLFAWVIFHIVVEIVLEIHYCCTFSELQGSYNETNADYDRINKLPVKKRNPPGFTWKPTLLFIYAIVTAIVVSALIIAIFLLES